MATGTEIGHHIWLTKYRYQPPGGPPEADIQASWRRVAQAVAAVEPSERQAWTERFYALLEDFRFLPGGRILAGAGTAHRVTLFNCFVMGVIEDSLDGIFDALKQGALTMQQGGGVGYDFSTLRPAGERAQSTGMIASGPVSFMRIWDSACATLLSTGMRRGAMMATLRCDHPDIEAFVAAKADPRELRHFNLSVQITDEFMAALAADADWPLVFPDAGAGEAVERNWPGHSGPVRCRVHRRLPARALWRQIMEATYRYAEPGVLFIDRINRLNNLGYRERISATNPCGEIPLPPYGACNLGSLNLPRFVRVPFTPAANLDWPALEAAAALAVRFLDNVIDASGFPLPQQAEQAHGSRRLGLGLTGLADALILLGLRYDSEAGRALAAEVLRRLRDTAYTASCNLAQEKGPFPFFDRDRYLDGDYVATLPPAIRNAIASHGLRNSHLLAIAPTGTISLLAGNVSSGIEPVYAARHERDVLSPDGQRTRFTLDDWACALWRREHEGTPPALVTAHQLAPADHLQMQAALQPYVDSAISKTINVPEYYPFEEFCQLYQLAYDWGLKGCTTFRPNPVTGAILGPDSRNGREASHCCHVEREAD